MILCFHAGNFMVKYLQISSDGVVEMKDKKEVIAYCLTHKNVYEDYPFRDTSWAVIRHQENTKVFAWIFEREGQSWVNVKADPEWRDLWRAAYPSVLPAYHLNKKYWNSIILDGTVPDKEIKRMIDESYDLTLAKKERKIPDAPIR